MCRTYIATRESPEGKRISTLKAFEFPIEEERQLPTCTCHIGDDNEKGNAVWKAFCDRLRPLLDEAACGRIVIEVM